MAGPLKILATGVGPLTLPSRTRMCSIECFRTFPWTPVAFPQIPPTGGVPPIIPVALGLMIRAVPGAGLGVGGLLSGRRNIVVVRVLTIALALFDLLRQLILVLGE